MIPFLDLLLGHEELKSQIQDSVTRVISSGLYIGGQEVDSFEEEFAAYTDSKYCAGVGNGLDALYLALKSLGVKEGDEVIVPSNTYIATWLAVTRCGATPVPVEPSLDTYNIDPALIEAAITSKTKAILPVHLYGRPADLDPILDLAKQRKIYVVEDAAQCQGAEYKNKKIGSFGDITAWSFYPGKNLGAMGDAGAITTNDPEIARLIKLMRNYGSAKKYVNEVEGINSRLDPLQAAILKVKLLKLSDWNAKRQRIAQRYISELQGLNLTLPTISQDCRSVWHLFVIRHARREEAISKMLDLGVQAGIHYPIPPHLQKAYQRLGYKNNAFPISELIHKEVISLPIYPQMTEQQVTKVIEVCKKVFS